MIVLTVFAISLPKLLPIVSSHTYLFASSPIHPKTLKVEQVIKKKHSTEVMLGTPKIEECCMMSWHESWLIFLATTTEPPDYGKECTLAWLESDTFGLEMAKIDTCNFHIIGMFNSINYGTIFLNPLGFLALKVPQYGLLQQQHL